MGRSCRLVLLCVLGSCVEEEARRHELRLDMKFLAGKVELDTLRST